MITVVEPGWSWVEPPDFEYMAQHLEMCGRTCYKSEERITDDSAEKFVRMICKSKHVSVLEHCSFSVRVVCSRACSHQVVRHRIAAYSQESQRYCNYGKKNSLSVICPPSVGLEPGDYIRNQYDCTFTLDGEHFEPNAIQQLWLDSVMNDYYSYEELIEKKVKPEDARFLLPNACKTELIMTMNLRTWMHVFQERALNPHAQWEIRGIFHDLYLHCVAALPCVFGRLEQ
jgi:thymidylate synthase (FAD)